MKRVWSILLVGVVACGSEAPSVSGSWKVTHRSVLPEGSALDPENAAKPGEANPQSVVYAEGKVYAALTNLHLFSPAGPSWITVHDAETLTIEKSVPLRKDGISCRNAGSLRVVRGRLYVACAGGISLDPESPSDDGVVVELELSSASISWVTTVGRSAGALLEAPEGLWVADLDTPTLMRVDAAGNVVNGLGASAPLPICATGYASDLHAVNGRAFATCFNDDTVQEFNLATGTRIGEPTAVGDGPIRMSVLNGSLAVLNSLGGTLTLLSLTQPASVEAPAILLGGETQGGNDSEGLAGDEQFAAVTNATVGTLVILDVQAGLKLIDAVDMKATPDAATNSPYGVAYGAGAFFVAVAGWGEPASEIIRVARP